ncbi:sigma-54-dependent transcriptional regulator [Aliikangiella coralliicola]|uniref:Sigma-54-dependent Fis family transcriptional regulator n=1 Tax=Aliikangiella coralliicola TaxID=2592383 RepID=A0A545UH82_9GAMM|nr:sigma-54 dependent transcriptional regulator [Aliikangiella coralliicola]TQV88818.1 sigma-54-dependent Fis family transcriptional regulator [Aliikangiella coralliicola]
MPCILVIDDRAEITLSLSMVLGDNGFEVIEAENPQVAQAKVKDNEIDLILLDMNYALDTTSGEEGLSFLKWMQESGINIPTVAMTAWSNVDLAVRAMQLGACDFIEKPWKNKRLLQIVQQQLAYCQLQTENSKLKQQLAQPDDTKYQWQSDCMQLLFQQIATVASTDVNVLLTGDNGTGKSEIAKHVHQLSTRKEQPLISVNMGAISESLFESEMFGHKKGAFTDAKNNRIGRFELAESGSLFLDEIANIPLSQQAKLLRVLETGEYEVLGSSRTKHTDVRIISATNGDIEKLIESESFREDLYYRLNTIEFHVPSLKERHSDILPLAKFFIRQFSNKYNRDDFSLSESAQIALTDYHWPGNIRELSHLIERAVLLTQHKKIEAEDLNLSMKKSSETLPLMTLEEAEIHLIELALNKTQKNIPKAAKLLGLTKSSLYRRLDKYERFQS